MIAKRIVLIIIAIILAGLVYSYFFIIPKLAIVNGYAAKKACSCYFISGRSIEDVKQTDLANSPLNLAELHVDESAKIVKASVWGLGTQKAYYKNDLGCVLIHGEDDLKNQTRLNYKKNVNRNLAWPYGSITPVYKKSGFNRDSIAEALDYAFDSDGEWQKKTRSVVIIMDDSIIAERYVEGSSFEVKELGWSMTKSFTNTLFGILEYQGKIDVHEDQLFPQWNDDRKEITIDQLLRMSSGLKWNEVYDKIDDATLMLFQTENMGQFALDAKIENIPGTYFEYSSGTTNILGQLIRKQFDSPKEYLEFPYKELVDKIGMSSMTLETDESGHYVLSSYGLATPRDWGKLGLLYLHEGIWNQDTIFNKSWLEYSVTPTSSCAEAEYGAHIWLNARGNDIPDLPWEMYRFSGYEGQYVYIIPSHQMVIVRTGLSKGPPFDMKNLVRKIINAVKK